MDKFSRIHHIAAQHDLKLSVTLSNSQDESSPCQRTTILYGEKKETKNCVLRIPKP